MLQRSDDWFNSRLGMVTASRVSDVMAKTKTGFSATRKNYMAQLVAEHLTGIPQAPDLSNNKAIQWGIENEQAAKYAYEFVTANTIEDCSFFPHPTIDLCGASPDGLVDDSGLVEIKCPNTATHIDYLLERKIPRDYQLQMTLQLACAKRKWCDFVSYDPRLDPKNNMLIIRFEPSQSDIDEIEKEISIFVVEMMEIIEKLRA